MKILVVGAGPAGLDFSIRAAEQGHDVTVIERRSDEKTSFCGEMTGLSDIPEGFARILAMESAVSRSKEIALIFLDDGYGILGRRNIPHKSSILIDSASFRSKLRALAEKKGVEFIFDTTVLEASTGEKGTSVTVYRSGKKETIRGDILVGADGVGSVVRRDTVGSKLMSLPSMRKKYLVKNDYPEGDFRFYFAGPFKFGYGWVYPGEKTKEGLVVNIGVGYIEDYVKTGMNDALKDFIEFLRRQEGLDIEELPQRGAMGNRIPYSGLVRPAGAERVLLLGDALGTVDAVVGGGLAGALTSSYEASKYLESKLRTGDTDFSDWYDYISGTELGHNIETSAKTLYAALRTYEKEKRMFERLSRYAEVLDEEMIIAIGEGEIKKRHLVKFIISHPLMTVSAFKRIGPLKIRRYMDEYERSKE